MKKISLSTFGLAFLLATVAVAAEPAAKPEAAKPAAAAAAPSPEAVAAGKKIDWEKMDVNAKKAYMKKTVLPTMKKLFAAFDKKHYSAMNCQTCHGKEANERKFKMPSPDLPKLPTDRAGFMALSQKKPEAVEFMGKQVKPTMAALLNKPEWEPTKPDGFGCYACHNKNEGPAPAAPPPGAAPAPAKPGAPPAAPPPGKGW